jgi:hypothetical protein
MCRSTPRGSRESTQPFPTPFRTDRQTLIAHGVRAHRRHGVVVGAHPVHDGSGRSATVRGGRPRRDDAPRTVTWMRLGSQAADVRIAQRQTPSRMGRRLRDKAPGGDLLLHEDSHYHRRSCVSLPSSGWDRVGPQRYSRQGKGGNSAVKRRFRRGVNE